MCLGEGGAFSMGETMILAMYAQRETRLLCVTLYRMYKRSNKTIHQLTAKLIQAPFHTFKILVTASIKCHMLE